MARVCFSNDIGSKSTDGRDGGAVRWLRSELGHSWWNERGGKLCSSVIELKLQYILMASSELAAGVVRSWNRFTRVPWLDSLSDTAVDYGKHTTGTLSFSSWSVRVASATALGSTVS